MAALPPVRTATVPARAKAVQTAKQTSSSADSADIGDVLERLSSAPWPPSQLRNAALQAGVALCILQEERAELVCTVEPRVETHLTISANDPANHGALAFKVIHHPLYAWQWCVAETRELSGIRFAEQSDKVLGSCSGAYCRRVS